MNLITQSRNDYYAALGIPPGPPTAKGIYGEAEYSGAYGDYSLEPLGNYDVPSGWPMKPYKRPYGGTPGPPVMYEKPSDPEDEGAGYGYSNAEGLEEKDIYFYHSDHLGSTSYITDANGNATQFVSYKPYGEALIDEHATSFESPWKFNGKELDAETGLYYYGARYYEPVLALWYGVDALAEKYTSVGGYVYCAGNPVRLVDVDGDSLTIVHNIGFLGFGGKETLTYKDGNLYNANGNKYSGRVNGFLKSVMGALKSLADTDEGTSLISELQNSTNTFTIMSGDNAFVPTSPNKAGANLSEVQAVTGNTDGSTGAGGIIYWNANSTSGGLNLNGNTYRPSYIGLGHEMGHASDSNQGLLHFSSDYTNPLTGETYVSTYNGLLKSEWRAVYRENIIRSQAKLPLRTHYGYDITSGTPQPTGPRLLDSSNKPINYQ